MDGSSLQYHCKRIQGNGRHRENVKEDFYKVISFYTPNYKKHVDRLVCSLEKFGIPYDIEELPSEGSWLTNTNIKPRFILKKYLECDCNLVWLDADSTVEKYPKYFGIISEDLGVYFHKNETLISGIVFVRHSGISRKVLELWERNAVKQPTIWDQKHLDNVVKAHAFGSCDLEIFSFPKSYCFVEGLDKGCEPVVLQHQASREFRRK